MKAEMWVFAIIGGFLTGVTIVYAAMTAATTGGVERVGTITLALSCVLCGMTGGYFWLVSRRIAPRPEDRPDAELSDGAGDVGFFSPHSYWPLAIGLGAAVAVFGIAIWQLWLTGVGIVCVIGSAAGMLFEYYSGANRGAEH
jgi:hypothetical protein